MGVKISVIKNVQLEDIIKEYGEGVEVVCPKAQVGQEWIVKDSPDKPEGFCSWAWADLHKDIIALLTGGNYPFMKKPGTAIACCTDGMRPVIFKLERV